MQKIASFTVDHRFITPGIYVSRIDGDVTTYDIRVKKPNGGDYLDNLTLHSVEHLFATFVRNSSIADNVIYFGPMGCRTGFYLLIRNANDNEVTGIIKGILSDIIEYKGDMPGMSEIECGNYRELSTEAAVKMCREYLELVKNWDNLDYNQG